MVVEKQKQLEKIRDITKNVRKDLKQYLHIGNDIKTPSFGYP